MKNLIWMLALVAACGSDLGEGSLEITLSGEDGAKEGFPVEEDGESIAFADGWSLKFTKYLVSLGHFAIRSSEGDVGVESSSVYVADLSSGDPSLTTFTELPARRWDKFSFEILAPSGEVTRIGSVSEEDVARMKAGSFSYWLEGEATRGDETITFTWGIAAETKNSDCTNGEDDKAGIVVSASSKAHAELTFHVEHLFWDSLGAEEAKLRFDAIAAMADENGHVSFEDLAQQSLSQPLDSEGEVIRDSQGAPVLYDPGAISLSENNLKGFMTASISSQAHLNGSGLCTIGSRR